MEYKRLTERDWHKEKFYPTTDNERVIRKQLWDLENKIEQGTLIELPCKVGDTVYLVHRDKLIIECWEVTELNIEGSGIWLIIRNNELLLTSIHSKSKGVCFTREEAEKKLKELQE